jgi:hypothetical protein
MPPRKNFAKSQEFVYKKVGKGSLGGSRQKYKLVATDIPRKDGSSDTQDAEAPPMLPPVVSAPPADDEPQSLHDASYFDNMYDARPKKSGKVRLKYTFILTIRIILCGIRGSRTT